MSEFKKSFVWITSQDYYTQVILYAGFILTTQIVFLSYINGQVYILNLGFIFCYIVFLHLLLKSFRQGRDF